MYEGTGKGLKCGKYKGGRWTDTGKRKRQEIRVDGFLGEQMRQGAEVRAEQRRMGEGQGGKQKGEVERSEVYRQQGWKDRQRVCRQGRGEGQGLPHTRGFFFSVWLSRDVWNSKKFMAPFTHWPRGLIPEHQRFVGRVHCQIAWRQAVQNTQGVYGPCRREVFPRSGSRD